MIFKDMGKDFKCFVMLVFIKVRTVSKIPIKFSEEVISSVLKVHQEEPTLTSFPFLLTISSYYHPASTCYLKFMLALKIINLDLEKDT